MKLIPNLPFSRDTLKAVASDSSWMAVEQITRLSTGFFVSVLLVRYLGPEQFGTLTFCISVVALIQVVSQLGLKRIITREFIKNTDQLALQSKLMSTVQCLRLGLAVLTVLALSISYLIIDNNQLLYISILSLLLVISISDTIECYLQSLMKMHYVAKIKCITVVVASGLRLACIYSEQALVIFVLLLVLEQLLAATILFYMQHKLNIGFPLRKYFDWKQAKILLSESWPEMFSGLSTLVFLKSDQIMLAGLTDMSTVGVYATGTRLSEAAHIIPAILGSTTFPYLVRAWERNRQEFYLRISQLMRATVAIFYIGIGVTLLYGDKIIVWLFTSIYLESVAVLKLHVISGLLLGFGVYSGVWLIINGKTIWALQRAALGALANIVLNFFWIPIYGMQGAACATVLSLALCFFLFDLFKKDMRHLFWIKVKALFLVLK